MVLWLIGLGLADERDITLRGLDAVRGCARVYLEAYTSMLPGVDVARLEALYGKDVVVADREMVESAADVILDGAMGSEGGSALFAWWKSFESLPAVREKRIRPVRSASLLRPGPHLGESAREIETLVWEVALPFVPPARESTAAVPSAAGGGHGAGAP